MNIRQSTRLFRVASIAGTESRVLCAPTRRSVAAGSTTTPWVALLAKPFEENCVPLHDGAGMIDVGVLHIRGHTIDSGRGSNPSRLIMHQLPK
jgi:hypothetical protein